ncbi:MAG: DNA polymerase I [Myxococcota bacterium]
MARIHVVDGSGYIFRAYWAIRTLTNSAGEATNAVYGFANMLEKMLREEQPTHLCLVFDASSHTFRNEIYPLYKANRAPPPEDLTAQVPVIRELVQAFGIKVFVIQGVEADDVIATLVRMAKAKDHEVRLISGDKDLMQLVEDGVSLYEPMKDETYDAAGVEKKLGVPPRQVADALALAGDSTDNIPGVKGVGLKTAAKYLAEFGDLAGVLAAAKEGKIKGKTGKTLAESDEAAELSRRLVALHDEVNLDIEGLEDLRYGGPDPKTLVAFYEKMEFPRLVERWGESTPDEGPAEADLGILELVEGRRIEDLDGLASVLEAAQEGLVVDLECGSQRSVDAPIFGFTLQPVTSAQSYYVPVGHAWVAPPQLSEAEVLDACRGLLEDPEVPKFSHQAKLVIGVLQGRGVQLRGLRFDSTLASYLLDPDLTDHDPPGLARRHFGVELSPRDAALKKERKRRSFDAVEPELATQVATEGLQSAAYAARALPERLEAEGLTSVLEDLELPLVPVLARMERRGVRIDLERLATIGEQLGSELDQLEKACFGHAGREFNVGSPKQLEEILFGELELKILERTSTGRPSTKESVLQQLADLHPLPAAVLEFRTLQKLKSTYVDALPKMVAPSTGRVHTRFNQAMAATGRLSSADPNLQNIPIRKEVGRQLRTVFVADEGMRLVSVDYSQVELRVLAHLSEEPVLIQAFADGADVHTRTASVLFEVAPEDVDREMRTQAKAVNFGVLYGMGPSRLARDLSIEPKLARKFIDDYFGRQPGVKAFIDDNLARAKASGEVRTILGRRRKVPDLTGKSRSARQAAERVATNTPIQGSAADLMKLAMLRVDAGLRERFPTAAIVLQVHDELLVEVPRGQAEGVADLVKDLMQTVYPLNVPLDAEAHIGATWDEAH